MVEDNDSVRVDSGGYSQTVVLKNAIQQIAVPEPPNGTLNVVGIFDGGEDGIITVWMLSGTAKVNLPVMVEGTEFLGVPVVVVH